MRNYSILFFLFITCPLFLAAQDPVEGDSLKVVDILNADRFSFKRIDSVTELQMMAGNVRIKQDNTIFEADSAVLNKNGKILEAFGNIHINDNDSIHTYSQYLLYHTDTKIAILRKQVRLTDNQSQLFTQELEYDVNQKIGIYRNGGRVVNKGSVLTSREATYFADVKDVYFRKDVKLKDPEYDLESDSLLYNTETQVATFITRTIIRDSTRRIETSEGYYDLLNKNAFFGQRPVIKDGAVTIIANEVETDDRTGISRLMGNAVFRDTAQGISILANYIESDNKAGSFFATQKPLMILKQDQDSIYVTGDTLVSGKMEMNQTIEMPVQQDSANTENTGLINEPESPEQISERDSMGLINDKDSIDLVVDDATGEVSIIDSTNLVVQQSDSARKISIPGSIRPDSKNDTIGLAREKEIPALPDSLRDKVVISPDSLSGSTSKSDSASRFFKVYHNVRIFSDSLQAVCDSLFYSGIDSVFQLFQSPIVWASGSQVTGDTILLFTQNKKAHRLFVHENGMLVNKSGEHMFNQIRGNRLTGYFLDGNIDYMRARGSAESVYYAKDKKDYLIGINRASGDIIDMRFQNKELQKVVFIRDVKGTMYPVRQMPETEKTLRNFSWQEEKRPKTKYELMGN